jgi:hypothetical protein
VSPDARLRAAERAARMAGDAVSLAALGAARARTARRTFLGVCARGHVRALPKAGALGWQGTGWCGSCVAAGYFSAPVWHGVEGCSWCGQRGTADRPERPCACPEDMAHPGEDA